MKLKCLQAVTSMLLSARGMDKGQNGTAVLLLRLSTAPVHKHHLLPLLLSDT